MGMAFPIGMGRALRDVPALSPWLWAVNGSASVCASVLAVVIALGAGISASFWTGALATARPWRPWSGARRVNSTASDRPSSSRRSDRSFGCSTVTSNQ